MNFNIHEINIKDFLAYSIVFLNGLIVFIVIFTYVKSYLNKKRSEKLKRLQNYWYKSFRDLTPIIIKKNMIEDFLHYWNMLFNRDDLRKRVRLIETATKMNLEYKCYRFVENKYKDKKLTNKLCLNIHTIGNINLYKSENSGDSKVKLLLEKIGKKGPDEIAFESVIALLKVDEKKYARVAINQLIKRINWNNEHHKQFTALNNNSAALSIFKKYLMDAHRKNNEDRIVEVIAATNNLPHFATFILRNYTIFSDNSLCQAMKNLTGRPYFIYVEPLMNRENVWFVDVNIINLIKKFRLFNTKNLNFLVDKLNSDNWWVINNSSEALAEYIKFDKDRYKNILNATRTELGKKSLKFNIEQYVINRKNDVIEMTMENNNG